MNPYIPMLIGISGGLLLVPVVKTLVEILILLDRGEGCLMHRIDGKLRAYSPKIQALCKDMLIHPEAYIIDEYRMESVAVCIWTASGQPFYKDYDRPYPRWNVPVEKAGKFSIFDQKLFHHTFKQLKKLKGMQPKRPPIVEEAKGDVHKDTLAFEIALRKAAGLIDKKD